MRILVTGGGGFLGTFIVKELLKDPSNIITSFSRHSYPHLEALGVPTFKGDLTNPADLEKLFKDQFDVIFHVAALAGVWGKYEDYFSINYIGTKNLIDAAKKAGVKKFIYTSSPSVVFGKDDLLGVDESQNYPDKYLTFYAETKAMAEKYVLENNNHTDFLTCAIRPHLIWGPGDPHLFPRVIQKGKEGKLKIVGYGDNIVDIIYVENAAVAHVLAYKNLNPHSPVCGEAYFIGQERAVNLWQFINQVLSQVDIAPVTSHISVSLAYKIGWVLEKAWKALGINKPEPPMTRFVALNLGKSHYFSHAKAKKHFGYEPKITIEEGLKRTFAGRELIKK